MTPQIQKANFEEQGYLIVENLLSPEELETCRQEIHHLHKLAAEYEEKDDPAFRNFQREPYAQDALQGENLPVLRKVEGTQDISKVFKDLSAHPDIIRVVQNLIGPDLLLFRSTLMLKPAHHGSVHGLHQDSAYWPMEPPTLVTVSIALNDATPENGCFQVIPGSHKWGLQHWGRIARDQHEGLTDREDVDVSGQIEVPLSAGSVLFFHSLMVHGSGPNTSSHSRNTALYAYFSPKVRYVPKDGSPREKTYPVVAGLGGKQEMTLVAEK